MVGGSGHRNAMMMGRGHGVAHGGHITIVLGSPCCPQGKEVLLHSRVDAGSSNQRGGVGALLLPTTPSLELVSAYAELMEQFLLSFTEGFSQLGIQLAAVFVHSVPELAGVRGGAALPCSPRCGGKSHSSFFLAAECLFLCILHLSGT